MLSPPKVLNENIINILKIGLQAKTDSAHSQQKHNPIKDLTTQKNDKFDEEINLQINYKTI